MVRTVSPGLSAAAILTVDLDALAANWRSLAARAAPAACAAVVKADAYGIGVGRAAPALAAAGCRTFFVATAEEGAELRQLLGPEPAIFAFNGPLAATVADLRAFDVIPVLNDLGQVALWAGAAAAAGRAFPAALHLDTGMNRLGLPEAEDAALAAEPGRLDGIRIVHVMSHLACAEEAGNPMNEAQRAAFAERKARLPAAPASLANSSGIFLGPAFHFEMARPGVALYGANPTPGEANPMSEVVHLQGRILQVRRVDTPQTVGYGAAFQAAGPTRIATVALGYADGYLRSLSNRGTASLAGVRVPVAGRVSMDLVTLDVSAVPPERAQPGALVDMIGGGIPLDEVAEAAGTIPYEILTALGQRYTRTYTGRSARP